MTKFYATLVLWLLAAGAASAQTESLNRFIDRHRTDAGITFAYLGKDLFEVASRTTVDDKDWKKLRQLVQNFGNLRILAGEKLTDGLALYREAYRLVPATEFDELLTVRAEQTRVNIWTRDDGDTVTDLVLLVGEPDEFVLICFSGALELGNLAELGKLLDAGEARDLAQTAQRAAIDFAVSPNPSRGDVLLTYADEHDALATLTVTDANGRPVAVRPLSGAATERVRLDELAAGLYWLQVTTRQGKAGVKPVQIIR